MDAAFDADAVTPVVAERGAAFHAASGIPVASAASAMAAFDFVACVRISCLSIVITGAARRPRRVLFRLSGVPC